ncbi:MAG TPA: radical SAM protein [Bacillota bacterium]|nr:radical SAM protein [Bacillota bacterium]
MNSFYQSCIICPHQCGINRNQGQLGRCLAPARPKIAKTMLHLWEEPCLSGTRGSGAVFFSHCNLRCIFCQNYAISQEENGRELTEIELSDLFLSLEQQGAHNINLVSPTPYVPSIVQALKIAKEKGLKIPVIYNTNAFDSPESIALLDGLVDIYLPDLKFYSPEVSQCLAGTREYFSHATKAILTMLEQVGPTYINEEGMMTRGVLIRHLILPGYLEESRVILRWIRDFLPREVYLSLMSQYFPTHRAVHHPKLNRTLNPEEYEAIIDYFLDLGLENGFTQDLDSADPQYVPDFDTEEEK